MAISETTKTDEILRSVDSILNRDVTRDEKLFAICEILADSIPVFDWVGFYLVDPEAERELVLGPFVGEPTDHTRIPFGKGICGQVAESHNTFISQDVSSEDNYIACSIDVKSEVVVPIMKNGEFVAQIDIDSHTKNAITSGHQDLLEDICDRLSNEF